MMDYIHHIVPLCASLPKIIQNDQGREINTLKKLSPHLAENHCLRNQVPMPIKYNMHTPEKKTRKKLTLE